MLAHKLKFILLLQLIATLNNYAYSLPPLANVRYLVMPNGQTTDAMALHFNPDTMRLLKLYSFKTCANLNRTVCSHLSSRNLHICSTLIVLQMLLKIIHKLYVMPTRQTTDIYHY